MHERCGFRIQQVFKFSIDSLLVKKHRKVDKKVLLGVKYNRPLHPAAEINICMIAHVKM